MGASASTTSARQLIQPEDIGEFRKHTGPADQYLIPEIPEKRKVTDFKFTVVFAVCLVILVPFLIYSFVNADLDRFIHGYDKCGNVCGEKNSAVDGISCSGEDKSSLPLLKYRKNPYVRNQDDDPFIQDVCVESCDAGYFEVMNRCFPGGGNENESKTVSEFWQDVASDINRSSGYIVGLCFIGLGLSVGMLFLFRYFVTVVVWVIIIGSLLGIVALTGFFWYLSSLSSGDNSNQAFYYFAIFFTILSIILVVVLICMFKRIKLIIRLFKEAIKVIFGIPLILAEPLLTEIAGMVLLIVFVFFGIVIGTAGSLQQTESDLYDYTPNVAMIFTLWYHVIICIWMAQFIIGCQHMVISGAVSSYYFARDKSTVNSPIYTSFYNLVRYHLGTVAFGSLIITIICIIKALIRGLVNNRQAKILVDCCLGAIEDFLKYLSKNAYIQTAMHGQPFFKSGKRAVRLLAANALSAIAVNSVGDFILFMARLLIVLCTILIGVLMNDPDIKHFWAAVLIAALVTAVIADCFFAVFETAIDTIFLCFCEDSCMNDGMERPYYMSVNLMQYVEEAKKTVKEKK